MNNLKKWTNVFVGLSILLSFLTIILFYSRIQVMLLCTTISSVFITIVLKLTTKAVEEEIDKLSMKMILLETTLMHKYNIKT